MIIINMLHNVPSVVSQKNDVTFLSNKYTVKH